MTNIPTQRALNAPVAATTATHKVNLTLIERPDTWISWCECGWEHEGGWDIVFRERSLHAGQRLSTE